MKNGKVSTLVNTLLGMSAPDWEHTQTVKIGERQHQKLRALAEFMGRSKTALAADLLMAAIDDAVESLPDEPMGGLKLADTGEDVTFRDYIKKRAEVFYDEVRTRNMIRDHDRGHGVPDDDEVIAQALDDFNAGKLPDEAYGLSREDM